MSAFAETMFLTFKVAFVTTIILLFIGIALAYFVANMKSRFRAVLEAVISMPLVLPPSVLGFYLLVAFSPRNFFGAFLDEVFDVRLVFTFEGLIIGSVLFSLPFMVHPIQSGFASLSGSLREAAATLGVGKMRTLFCVLLPNMKSSILTGTVLTFAHTVGEFGVVLMIGGSIPGQTKVASISIYQEVESLNYAAAHEYAFTLFIITFALLLAVYIINHKFFSTSSVI
ncbi:molybdenum ABC transporter permease subunit [Campylobacterota bacterium]|nr:molybdenum ABC transporter permease subunit [Campylobacterota bacterium]GHV07127.1 molybdenum ABC transporter permease subunit [Campylobacterota bacterium]